MDPTPTPAALIQAIRTIFGTPPVGKEWLEYAVAAGVMFALILFLGYMVKRWVR